MANVCLFNINIIVEEKSDVEEIKMYFTNRKDRTVKGIENYVITMEEDNQININGDCRWAVATNMIHKEYINEEKNITLQEISEFHSCRMEVESEEFGFNFKEAFIIENGSLIVEEVIDTDLFKNYN